MVGLNYLKLLIVLNLLGLSKIIMLSRPDDVIGICKLILLKKKIIVPNTIFIWIKIKQHIFEIYIMDKKLSHFDCYFTK